MVKKSPLGVFIALLLGISGLSFWLGPYRSYPTSSETSRIPILQRGWPEYTQIIPRTDSVYEVVILGNSQALGYELERRGNFTAQLQQAPRGLLQHDGRPARIHNWSLGGMRTVDLEILLARAIEQGADKVVFLLHMDSFESDDFVRLGYTPCDNELLLAEPDVSRAAQSLRIGNRISIEDRVRLWVQRYSGLYRWRTRIWDESTRLLSPNHEEFLKGKRDAIAQVVDFNAYPEIADTLRQKWFSGVLLHQNVPPISKEDVESRRLAFMQFTEKALPLLQQHRVSHEFIWAPYYAPMYDSLTLETINRGFIEPTLFDNQVNALDWSRAIDDSLFISRAHLSQRGHDRMAELLLNHWSNGI